MQPTHQLQSQFGRPAANIGRRAAARETEEGDMPFKNDLIALIDDSYRSRSFREIAAASPAVLGGLTSISASKLMEALDVRTVEELATSKYVLWAQSITHLSRWEKVETIAGPVFNPSLATILDSRWEKKRLRDIVKAPPSVLAGLTPKSAKLLDEALGIRTIEALAASRVILLAQAIAQLAKHEDATGPAKRAA
jgi:hypothetical protein